jgi:hypothetical protein
MSAPVLSSCAPPISSAWPCTKRWAAPPQQRRFAEAQCANVLQLLPAERRGEVPLTVDLRRKHGLEVVAHRESDGPSPLAAVLW